MPLYLSRFSYIAGGALSSFETTVLLTVDETIEDLGQAG